MSGRSETKMYRPRNFVFVVAVGIIFVIVGAFLAFKIVLPENARFLRFRNATPVAVTAVNEVDLVRRRSQRGTTTSEVTVEYLYGFDGVEYLGDTPSVYHGGDNFGSFQENLYQRIQLFQRRGGSLNCYVLSDDPSQSVIDRSFRPGRALAPIAMSAAFLGLGGLAVVVPVLRFRRYFPAR